jgi:hypothetical protein
MTACCTSLPTFPSHSRYRQPSFRLHITPKRKRCFLSSSPLATCCCCGLFLTAYPLQSTHAVCKARAGPSAVQSFTAYRKPYSPSSICAPVGAGFWICNSDPYVKISSLFGSHLFGSASIIFCTAAYRRASLPGSGLLPFVITHTATRAAAYTTATQVCGAMSIVCVCMSSLGSFPPQVRLSDQAILVRNVWMIMDSFNCAIGAVTVLSPLKIIFWLCGAHTRVRNCQCFAAVQGDKL